MTEPAQPDLVITGAALYGTPDPGATAIALQGDRILAIGREDDVRAQAGPDAEQRHLPGRLVLPGFQDAHVHPPQAGRNRLTVDLDGLAGVDAYVAAVRDYAAAHPDEEWIVGG